MLSKNASKVYKIAKESKEKKVSYYDLKNKLNWDSDKVKSACGQLIDMNLAVEKCYSPMPGTAAPWGIVLTENGRNMFKYRLELAFMFLVKSIILPIIVSIITTLVTLWLTRILGH